MRVNKADLVRALDNAAKFNQLPLHFNGPAADFMGFNDEIKCKITFVPVCQYGRGMIPLRGEWGTDGVRRYLNTEQ